MIDLLVLSWHLCGTRQIFAADRHHLFVIQASGTQAEEVVYGTIRST